MIDVIEIDSEMIEIAKNLFFFTKSERVNIYVTDGFDYVMNLKKTQSYDLIILDAFAKGKYFSNYKRGKTTFVTQKDHHNV